MALESTLCAICLATLHGTENESLPCGHTYHVSCIAEYAAIRGVHRLDIRCPACKCVPSVLISEPALGDGQSIADEDTQTVEVVELPETPKTRGPETFPETPFQDAQSRSNVFGKSSRGSSAKKSRRDLIGSEVKDFLKSTNLLRKQGQVQKKPAAASKLKSDNSAIGVPEADSPSDSKDLSKNPEGGLAAASKVAKPDTKMVGLHKFWSNPILDDTNQNDNQDVHQGGRKRMRSKTYDDQPPPAAPPATKKQKAETAQKAKGEAAQSSESKKRSLDEPASSTQTEAVKKAKSGRKAAEAEETPPKPAPDSETGVIEVATQVAAQGSVEKRCFFCNEAESQSVKAFQVNSKKAGTYKCQKCTSSRTYFYKSGDFPEIIKLTEEDRWKFFQTCKNAQKKKPVGVGSVFEKVQYR